MNANKMVNSSLTSLQLRNNMHPDKIIARPFLAYGSEKVKVVSGEKGSSSIDYIQAYLHNIMSPPIRRSCRPLHSSDQVFYTVAAHLLLIRVGLS